MESILSLSSPCSIQIGKLSASWLNWSTFVFFLMVMRRGEGFTNLTGIFKVFSNSQGVTTAFAMMKLVSCCVASTNQSCSLVLNAEGNPVAILAKRNPSQCFYWPGMTTSVHEWCQTCNSCMSCKEPQQTRQGALENMKAGYSPEIMVMDIVGPLPTSKTGNKHILVISDYFTKWA